MVKSKTNSVKVGKYKFQPTKYDKYGNLYCTIYRNDSREQKCKLTLLYKFEEGTYEIIWVEDGWLNHNHKKMLNFFLKEYDWI